MCVNRNSQLLQWLIVFWSFPRRHTQHLIFVCLPGFVISTEAFSIAILKIFRVTERSLRGIFVFTLALSHTLLENQFTTPVIFNMAWNIAIDHLRVRLDMEQLTCFSSSAHACYC